MLAIKQSVGKMAPFTRMAVARFSNTVTLSADDKPKVVVADITDSIEWWYVAPIFNANNYFFLYFGLNICTNPFVLPPVPHSMPSPPPQHMFEEPPILVEVKGDDEKHH